MPDVIIKGMEMPESCYCCRANNGVYCFAVPDDADDVVGPYYRARSGKPDWCPLRPAPEWISVEERLPEREGDYLVWTDLYRGHAYTDYYVPGIGWDEYEVLAWMPLPEPPEGGAPHD